MFSSASRPVEGAAGAAGSGVPGASGLTCRVANSSSPTPSSTCTVVRPKPRVRGRATSDTARGASDLPSLKAIDRCALRLRTRTCVRDNGSTTAWRRETVVTLAARVATVVSFPVTRARTWRA